MPKKKPTQSEIILAIWSLHDKHERWYALEEVASKLSPKAFYRAFVEVWSNSESNDVFRTVIDNLIASYAVCADNVMPALDPDERKQWAALPDPVPVYRGTTLENPFGDDYSWSTDKEKALWFAQRCFEATPALAEGVVAKKDAYFFYNGRGESEIAVHHDKVQNRTLTAVGEWQENSQYKFYAAVQHGALGAEDRPEMIALRIAGAMRGGMSFEDAKAALYLPVTEGERLGFIRKPKTKKAALDAMNWEDIREIAKTMKDTTKVMFSL